MDDLDYEPGLVAVTRLLTPDDLYRGYKSGLFPWSGRPARWYCPDPRAVFPLDGIYFPRRLLRTVRQGRYEVTFDQAFLAVIESCREHHRDGTWIDDAIVACYLEFHRRGFAHSVEIWEGRDLVGGLYGVQIHRMFAGESMFSRKRDTSKIAFYHLVEKLRSLGVMLFDAQVPNSHTRSFGVVTVPREVFLERLAQAVEGCGAGAISWTIDG